MRETFAIDTHSSSVLRASARHMAARLMMSMTDAAAGDCVCAPCGAWRTRYENVVQMLEEWVGPASCDVPLTGESREHWIVELATARVDPRLGGLALALMHVVAERLAHSEEGRKHDAGYALLYYALTNADRARRLWLSLPTRAEVEQDAERSAIAGVRKVQRAAAPKAR